MCSGIASGVTRLDLLDRDEIPDEYQYLFTDEYLGDRHIFRVWAPNPELLEATLEYLNTLYDQLTPRTKELVILTVARARGVRYEWHQHVDIAREKDVTTDEMRAIGGDDFSVFDDGEFVLVQYAEAVATGDVTDQIHAALETAYSPAEIVAAGLIVDFYVGLCNYVASVELPFEGGEFVGWTPDDETITKLFGENMEVPVSGNRFVALGVAGAGAMAVISGQFPPSGFPVDQFLAHWWVFPTSIVFATVALSSGVSGALFFSPFFMLVVGLTPSQAIGAGLLTEVFGMGNGLRSYVKQRVVDFQTAKYLLAGSVPAIIVGAFAAHYVDPTILKLIFGAGLLLLGGFLVYYEAPENCEPGECEGEYLKRRTAVEEA